MNFIVNFIKNLFIKTPKIQNDLIGYWGVWDSKTGESTLKGEMYSYDGKWVPGPEIYKDKEI